MTIYCNLIITDTNFSVVNFADDNDKYLGRTFASNTHAPNLRECWVDGGDILKRNSFARAFDESAQAAGTRSNQWQFNYLIVQFEPGKWVDSKLFWCYFAGVMWSGIIQHQINKFHLLINSVSLSTTDQPLAACVEHIECSSIERNKLLKQNPRIIGGVPAQPGQFKSQVAVSLLNSRSECTISTRLM